MGNSPLTVCIHQVWEKQTVQVVQPDGQVLYMQQPMTVANLLESHPSHFVCHGSPPLLEQRLPADTKLEAGEIYYLLPIPRPYFPAQLSFHRRNTRPRSRKAFQQHQQQPGVDGKPSFSPPNSNYASERSSVSNLADYAQLNIKPQGCLINFFVFRQSVASAVSPEETFKPQSNDCNASRPPARKYQKFDVSYRGGRGRRPSLTWRPHLESISETKPVNDFSRKNHISSFSVALFSTIANIRMSSVAPAIKVSSSPTPTVSSERECQKQKLMYSA